MKRIEADLLVTLAVLVSWIAMPGFAPIAHAAVPDDFVVRTIATGVDQPVALDALPDGRLLVAEQRTGNLRLILGDETLVALPVLTVPGLELGNSEAGLLSLAVDPRWPEEPHVYCHYTNASPSEMRLTRYTATGTLDDPQASDLAFGSPVQLLTGIPDVAGNHNGGTLAFGSDGLLYFSIGDDETQCAVFDIDRFEGKVLRLDVSGIGSSDRVTRSELVATGNPFVGQGDIASLVWTKGLRNPFRMVIDPVDDALFIGDVGQVSREEISYVTAAGVDLGWPFREGNLVVLPGDGCTEPSSPQYQGPIWDYGRTEGRSVVAAFVYRAPIGASRAWPAEYEGDFFYVDFFEGDLVRLTGAGQSWSRAAPVGGQPSGDVWGNDFGFAGQFRVAADGSIDYVDTFGDAVRQIRFEGTASDTPQVPSSRVEVRARPNPFNPGTVIEVRAPEGSRVEVTVHDARGRHVAELWSGVTESALTELPWRVGDLASGVYHVRVDASGVVATEKVTVVE